VEPIARPEFAALLRQFRLDAGITQQELAERARLSVEAIGTLERGTRRRPHRETVTQLAGALGLSPEQQKALLDSAGATPHPPRPRAAGAEVIQAPWLVPDAIRTPHFTGRDAILELVRSELAAHRRAALSGLGGVGKTQAAIEYAARHRGRYPDGVFWVNAETVAGLTAGFVEIGKALGLVAPTSSDQEQIVRGVLSWLNRNDRWLLILDNVDDRRELRPFLPARGKGDVLITSLESVFHEIGIADAIEVGDLGAEEAVRLLLRRAGRDYSDSREHAAATELARELDYFPLALEQAAAFVGETNVLFADYLRAFRKRRVHVLEKAGGLVSRSTVAATWAATFEALQRASPAAADVLRTSAFLAPEAIPFELFELGAAALGAPIATFFADSDELAAAELLRPLARYSLIRPSAESRAFRVHRLVQEIVRATLGTSDSHAYAGRAAAALDAAFPDVDYATWPQCDRLVPNVSALAARVAEYDVCTRPAAAVLNKAASYLRERARYAEAQRLYEQALSLSERACGPDDPESARSLSGLANAHRDQGRYAEALPLHERALAIRERVLSPDHPEIAASLSGLAVVLWDRGMFAEALPLHQRALAIRERALGPDHRDVARSLNNLATVYAEQGRYAEARPLFERSVGIWERALGADHPNVALTLNNLAYVEKEQGRFVEAQALFERAQSIWERALGPDDPNVAYRLDGLADLYRDIGRYADAEELYGRALAIAELALGPEHPVAAYNLAGLANVRAKLGHHAEARALYARALAIYEGAYGPDHPDVAQVVAGLAALAQDEGRTTEAIVFYERALTIKTKTFGPDHPDVTEIRKTLEALNPTAIEA